MDTSDQPPSMSLSTLLTRWFVQFNPLFTMSAMCVLVGVFWLGRQWGDAGVVRLAVVVEAYQWVLIGAAALLFRRLHDHRPGVILGLIALAFLLDPSMQTSAFAGVDGGMAFAFVWWALFVAKLAALQFALCVRLSRGGAVLGVLVGGLVALLPQARVLVSTSSSTMVSMMAIAVVAIGVWARLAPLRLSSTRALDAFGAVVLGRVERVVAVGLVVAVMAQGANVVLAIGSSAALALIGAGFLAFVIVARVRTDWVFVGVAAVLVMLHAASLAPVVALPLVATALFFAGQLRPDAPRFWTAAALLLAGGLMNPRYWGVFGVVDLGLHHVSVLTSLAVVLAMLTWHRRSPSAALALVGSVAWSGRQLAIVVVRAVVDALASIADAVVSGLHAHPAGVGVGLLGLGFLLVPAGVVLQRRLQRRMRMDAAPTTSAACFAAEPG